MKARSGFVSNSSSSSFVCVAVGVDPKAIDPGDVKGLFGLGKMLCEGLDRLWFDGEMVALMQEFPEAFGDKLTVYRRVESLASLDGSDGGVVPIDKRALADFAEAARHTMDDVVLVGENVDQNSTHDARRMIEAYVEKYEWNAPPEAKRKNTSLANRMHRFLSTLEKVRQL